jgi:type VI secretion system protein VasL
VLQRLELKHLSQFDTLRTLIRSNAERLESSNDASDLNANMMPGCELPQERAEPVGEVKWVYVVQPENQPNAEDRTTAHGLSDMETLCRRDVFYAGGWRRRGVGRGLSVQTRSLTTQAIASLAPLPEVLTCSARRVSTARYFTVHLSQKRSSSLPDWISCLTGIFPTAFSC